MRRSAPDHQQPVVLRVLHIEDNDDDATLIAEELRAVGFDPVCRRVESPEQLVAALNEPDWDVVLSDHVLPGFSSTHALRIALERALDAPFIIVSGRIGEEAVAAGLRAGAADYVNKDDLSSLGPAVRRSLDAAGARRTERALQAALRDSQAQLAAAQRVARVGSWDWDTETNRVSWSDELHRIYGVDPASFTPTVDAFVERVHPDDRDRVQALIDAAYHAGGTLDYEHRIVRPGGEIRTLQCRGNVVADDGGVTARMFGTAQDITQRKAAEAEARQTQVRLQALLDYAPFPISMRGLDGRFQLINSHGAALIGQTPEQLLNMPPPELLDPDVDRVLDEHERRVRAGEGAVSFELSGTTPDGSQHEYFVTKYPVTDTDGEIIGVGGISLDITARKRVEDQLREAEERFRTAFENAPIGKALVTLDGRWMRVNKAICDITGWPEDELLSKTFQDITHPDDLDADLAHLSDLLAGDIAGYQMEKRYFNADGNIVWVNLSVALVRSPAGEPQYFISQIQDISDRKRLEERLRHLADHDPLTGARNRRLFEHDLNDQIARCQRYGEHAALLILDLDDFKQINDTHGHKTGDDVLKAVATTIQQRLRTSDIVARLGGDEFALILGHTTPAQAETIARELTKRIATTNVTVGETTISPTVSIGVAHLDEQTSRNDDPLIHADRAMYAAKRASKTAPSRT